MNLNIAICDDDAQQIEFLKELVLAWEKITPNTVTLTAYTSAEEFLFHYSDDRSCDILLLDIEMGKLSGIDLAREIRKDNTVMQIIFVTGYYEYFSDGFDVSALHYLIKPVDRQKLHPVLERAAANLAYRERSLVLTADKVVWKIPLADIMYLEAERTYVTVHTQKSTYRTKISLTKLAEELDNTFYKVHRSYIVSMKYIKMISRTELKLQNDETIPISRGMYDKLHMAMIKNL